MPQPLDEQADRGASQLSSGGYPGVQFGRRAFLRAGALGYLGLSLSDLLRSSDLLAAQGAAGSPVATAKSCILIWLHGGQSQLDSWDVKGNSGFNPIKTNVPGIEVSDLQPRIAQHMDKLSIIRSMTSPCPDHPGGTYYAFTGHLPNTTTRFPSVGSIISQELGRQTNLPAYISSGRGRMNCRSAGFTDPQYEPFLIPNPGADDFQVSDLNLPEGISVDVLRSRRTFLNLVDQKYRQLADRAEFSEVDTYDELALNMILSPAVRQAFDLSQESAKTRETYGPLQVGQGMLLARRLVEAGCRCVTIDGFNSSIGGDWDTHFKNDADLRDRLAPPFDQSLAALLEDLDQRGLLESTIVLTMGEFGRTPDINPGAGRDHWPHCWSLALGGGGIQGGRVVGASDDRAAYVADRPVTIGDLFATLYKALGIDWTKTYLGPGNRPVYIANSLDDEMGQPVNELF